MITVETIVGFALREKGVLDALGPALRSDLVLANPFYREIAAWADDFLAERRKMPLSGDWTLWIGSLPEQRREGIREALGRLLVADISEYDPEHFAERVLDDLKTVAAQTAVQRLSATPEAATPEGIAEIAERIEDIRLGSLEGLAALSDLDLWLQRAVVEDLLPTGFPKLDEAIGGWGEELWIVFADSGVGKSMFLQNAAKQAAQKGRRVCHISLELGLRPQIYRYYREISQRNRTEFASDLDGSRSALEHWFRLAQGEIFLLEFPAYSLDPLSLTKILHRAERTIGEIGFIVLDYLDLVGSPPGSRGRGYEDLGKITHLLRSNCAEFSCPVITASQAVRRPKNADRLTTKDMGDSYNKVRGADGILALNQTDEEKEIHQGRLGVLKARESRGSRREILLYVNRDLALLADWTHENTIQLQRSLGHPTDEDLETERRSEGLAARREKSSRES